MQTRSRMLFDAHPETTVCAHVSWGPCSPQPLPGRASTARPVDAKSTSLLLSDAATENKPRCHRGMPWRPGVAGASLAGANANVKGRNSATASAWGNKICVKRADVVVAAVDLAWLLPRGGCDRDKHIRNTYQPTQISQVFTTILNNNNGNQSREHA